MILRIDDYPAGIRPIQPGQLILFDKMIEILPTIHLGIVPVTYMRYQCQLRHKNIIPCMHGWEHGYMKYSELLKNDPFNRFTVGVFDEFKDYSDEDILLSLINGKKYLENEFECEVDTYIPCCNVIDRRLADLIYRAGFKQILCENKVRSSIPIIQSGFYGKLKDMNDIYDVVCLHLPWEWDTIQEKGFNYWESMVYEKL